MKRDWTLYLGAFCLGAGLPEGLAFRHKITALVLFGLAVVSVVYWYLKYGKEEII